MIGRIRRALVHAFGGVLIDETELESLEDRQRRERLQLQLEPLAQLSSIDAATRREELRRLALTVVCEWTDDASSDAEFQDAMEQLADYLLRTAL